MFVLYIGEQAGSLSESVKLMQSKVIFIERKCRNRVFSNTQENNKGVIFTIVKFLQKRAVFLSFSMVQC